MILVCKLFTGLYAQKWETILQHFPVKKENIIFLTTLDFTLLIHNWAKYSTWIHIRSATSVMTYMIYFALICFGLVLWHINRGTIYQPLRSGRIWHKVNF